MAVGEELTFDYGPQYWTSRPPPAPETDSRNYSAAERERRWVAQERARPRTLSLCFPPPMVAVLPLTPLTAAELRAALMLPEPECRHAMLRCLEYFGALERREDGALAVRRGLAANAPVVVLPEPAELTPEHDATLRAAAASCLNAAVMPSLGSAGADGDDDERSLVTWLATADAELDLIRKWRVRMPRLASRRHDAAALAAYLVWKHPAGHGAVDRPISRDRCNALIAEVAADARDTQGADAAVVAAAADRMRGKVAAALAEHADTSRITALLDTLERGLALGDGATVVSHAPPTLAAAVPLDWRRAYETA